MPRPMNAKFPCPAALAFLLAASACSNANSGKEVAEPAAPGVQVSSPTSGLLISATIKRVVLAYGCNGFGGAYVCQSSLDIRFTAAAGPGQSARVRIATVELLDATSGKELGALTLGKPQVRTGADFGPWDETVAPAQTVDAHVDLSSPAWADFESSGITDTPPGARSYNVRVSLSVDGLDAVVESTDYHATPPD